MAAPDPARPGGRKAGCCAAAGRIGETEAIATAGFRVGRPAGAGWRPIRESLMGREVTAAQRLDCAAEESAPRGDAPWRSDADEAV